MDIISLDIREPQQEKSEKFIQLLKHDYCVIKLMLGIKKAKNKMA